MEKAQIRLCATLLTLLTACTASAGDDSADSSDTVLSVAATDSNNLSTEVNQQAPDHILFDQEDQPVRLVAFGLNRNMPFKDFDDELHVGLAGDDIEIAWHTIGCAGGRHSGLALRTDLPVGGRLEVKVLEQVPDEKGRPCNADIKSAGAILRLGGGERPSNIRLEQYLNGRLARSTQYAISP